LKYDEPVQQYELRGGRPDLAETGRLDYSAMRRDVLMQIGVVDVVWYQKKVSKAER
jgi:hypothetical protein